jgi:hypothetical protein
LQNTPTANGDGHPQKMYSPTRRSKILNDLPYLPPLPLRAWRLKKLAGHLFELAEKLFIRKGFIAFEVGRAWTGFVD